MFNLERLILHCNRVLAMHFSLHVCCKYWGWSHSLVLLQSSAMSLENLDSDASGIYWVCTGFICGSCSCMFFFPSPHFPFSHNPVFVNTRQAIDCIFVLFCLFIIFFKIRVIWFQCKTYFINLHYSTLFFVNHIKWKNNYIYKRIDE